MKKTYTIRRFRLEDLDQVMYINRTCLPENYSTYFFIDLYKNFPETFIVAEEGNRVVGYIMCRIEGGFSGFSLVKRGHVISIAVLPEHRHKGIGETLLKEALQSMMNHGVKECYLEVRVSNTPAINLYKKVGFKIEKVIRGYYSDGEDAYLMRIKMP
ncbi:MAG: ribosomal protein S18-alanine N-acetyltransferase [Candidatus Bathyarchaeota archaeon]|nr:ribosomal protein S18-alanine N-acetyltransferase [Candidatus Bathyarchaeota archaeon]